MDTARCSKDPYCTTPCGDRVRDPALGILIIHSWKSCVRLIRSRSSLVSQFDRPKFRRHISYPRHVPNFVSKKELVTIGSAHERRSINHDLPGNKCCPQDPVVFREKHARENIKVSPVEIADSRQLARSVMPCDPSCFDLITRAILTNSVHICLRVSFLRATN